MQLSFDIYQEKIHYYLVFLLLAILSNTNLAAAKNFKSDYIGQENRTIKSLSENDIKQLKNGKGWGLAKAAELNGVPGPSHLLQMKKEINLTESQVQKISVLYEDMKKHAIVQGLRLILLEDRLDSLFANFNKDKLTNKPITRESLEVLLSKIAETRKNLRLVHLATHLQTPQILSHKQIVLYNRLRGYGSKNHNSKGQQHSH